VLNLSLALRTKALQVKAFAVDHLLQVEAMRISTPPPYSANHTFVSWVEMSGSPPVVFRGKRNRTASNLPLPDRANSTRKSWISGPACRSAFNCDWAGKAENRWHLPQIADL